MMNGSQASAMEMKVMCTAWRSLAEDWALTWEERRLLLPAGGEHDVAVPADTETRMRLLLEVARGLRLPLDEEAIEWLRAPCAVLRWRSPLDVMSSSLAELRYFRRLVEAGYGS